MTKEEQSLFDLRDYDKKNNANAAASARPDASRNRLDYNLCTLKLHQLEPSPDHPRKVIDDADIENAMATIQSEGKVVEPIVVTAAPNQRRRYTIISGLLRFHAAKRLGLEEVPCHIVECKDRRLLRLLLDLSHNPLHPVDLADGVAEAGKHLDGGQAALAEIIGRHKTEISRSSRIAALSPDVKAAIRAKPISASVIYELSDPAFDDKARLRLLERPEKLTTDWLRAEAGRRQNRPATPNAIAKVQALLRGLDRYERWLKTNGGTDNPGSLTLDQTRDRLAAFLKEKMPSSS
jgi:ParB/RepB/Spo0J family partition protein